MYKFPCGCEFEVIGEPKYKFEMPRLKIDFYKIKFDCEAAWDIIREGNTVGVFQLETKLGQDWSKRVSPDNLEHLAAIGSILRPGCLRAITEDKSMTAHYADRKNNREETKSYHPIVDKCLSETYNLLVYQEQAMSLAKEVAMFSLEEADNLRKAMGKKLASEMAKVKTMFKEKGLAAGILNEAQIDEVFGWIQESQRYSFNKSHACEYGIISYWTAYAKAHGSHAFYTAWLKESVGQQDGEKDVIKLTSNAMTKKVKVNTPTLLTIKDNFYTNGQEIYFGLVNIKGVGNSVVKKLHESIKKAEGEVGKPLDQFTWVDFLLYVSGSVNSKAMTAMIMCGALDFFKLSRTRMKYEYEKFILFNENELTLIKAKLVGSPCLTNQPLLDFLGFYCDTRKNGGVIANERRLDKVKDVLKALKKAPFDLSDSPNKILENEKRLLGVALTYNIADSISNDAVNCTCYEFAEGKPLESFVLGVEILDVRPYNIKRGKQIGKQMFYLDVSDGTQNMPNCTVFPDTINEYGSLITKGNRVLLFGKRDNKYNSFTVQKVIQA